MFVALFLFGREHDDHAFAFKQGHLFDLAVVFEVVGKAEQKNFALLFEQNGAAFEENVGLYLGAFLEEADGVFELEVIVVVVGLRTETDFLNNDFDGLGFLFLLVLFLLVEELLVVKDFADGGLGVGRDFNEVEFLLVGHSQGLLNGVDALLNVVADQAHLLGADAVVDSMLLFGLACLGRALGAGVRARSRRTGSVDRFFSHSVRIRS